MTSLSPGQRPPQVTMPAVVGGGSKNICARGPATSKLILPAASYNAAGVRVGVIHQDAVGVRPEMDVGRSDPVEGGTESGWPEGFDCSLHRAATLTSRRAAGPRQNSKFQ